MRVVAANILSFPPGCFGTNSVMSHTTSSTTIQQSCSLECALISSTETVFSAILTRNHVCCRQRSEADKLHILASGLLQNISECISLAGALARCSMSRRAHGRSGNGDIAEATPGISGKCAVAASGQSEVAKVFGDGLGECCEVRSNTERGSDTACRLTAVLRISKEWRRKLKALHILG